MQNKYNEMGKGAAREETSLSRAVRIAQDKAAYDAACKRILAQKRILAWILKECVEEFRDCSLEDIETKHIEGTPQVGDVPLLPEETNADLERQSPASVPPVIHGENTEDASLTEGTVTYDVRFRAIAPKDGEYITLLLNAEGQKDYTPGYPLPKRGIYYCSRMISSQYGTEFDGARYEQIKKVYSIWICLEPPKQRQNMITLYKIHEVNLIGDVREPKENYDLMTLVMICLGKAENSQNRTLQMLDVLFSKEKTEKKRRKLEEAFGLPMSQALKEEVVQMCNFSDVIEAQAIKSGLEKGMKQGLELGLTQGLEQGLEQGLTQGLEQGRREAEMETAQRMMENGLSVEMICRCTHLTEEEVEKLVKVN